MIFVSDQAFISKWWWIGAIRKTRRLKYLKLKTWMITESASIAKIPPISSSRKIVFVMIAKAASAPPIAIEPRSEEHTSELQSRENLVCRLLLEKKKKKKKAKISHESKTTELQ